MAHAPPPSAIGPTMDLEVLEGLEAYCGSAQFLRKLEVAHAEALDLSNAGGKAPQIGWPHVGDVELTPHAATAPRQQREQQATPVSVSRQPRSFLSRWSLSFSRSCSSAGTQAAGTGSPSPAAVEPPSTPSAGSPSSSGASEQAFQLVDQQPASPAEDAALQEPFVLVSADDAIEGMAYYIALYLSRAPEARGMEPKALQEALRSTFTAIRRQRWQVVWAWGRCLYRWGAVSYSALQLYEHPWLVRAVVVAIWTSSKMALGFLW